MLSEAGDVNGDGFDDIVIGGMTEGSGGPGASKIYFGGKNMDGLADVNLAGFADGDQFGYSVAGGRDVNGDGYDDVIIGAPANASLGHKTGAAYVFNGGAHMDNRSDTIYPGYGANSAFGNFVELIGSVCQDDCSELLIGATGSEKAFLFGSTNAGGVNDTKIYSGDDMVWKMDGSAFGRYKINNFAVAMNSYLKNGPTAFKDSFGNEFVKIMLGVTAGNEANVTLNNLRVIYQFTSQTVEFSKDLNDYINAHQNEKDPRGNISIPIKVSATSGGRVRLRDLSIEIDEAPELVLKIPDLVLPEDTANDDLIDIRQYFMDDYDPPGELQLKVLSATNGSFVSVGIRDNRFLTADAFNGTKNDNWTGETRVVLTCTDTNGHSVISNPFVITVFNINDPPVITSRPVTKASSGRIYYYDVNATDCDTNLLTFRLVKNPVNMTINTETGVIRWIPTSRGNYDVLVEVSDGSEKDQQGYAIEVANSPPMVKNTTIPVATVGIPYEYSIIAEDGDNDSLTYSLSFPVRGMNVDMNSGKLTWTPFEAGDQPVSVEISDGIETVFHNFSIQVKGLNGEPIFNSKPSTEGMVGVLFSYEASASDPDMDVLTYSLVSGPTGMRIDASTGKLEWMPATEGQHKARIQVSDGKGGMAYQEFTIKVIGSIPPVVNILTPVEGEKLKGQYLVTGTVIKGTFNIVSVQISIDGGGWANTSVKSNWTFSLDTTALKKGRHTLQARAFDGTHYSDTVNRTILIDNTAPSGKGFIPGFTGAIFLFGVITGLLMIWRSRRPRHVQGIPLLP